MKTGYEAKEPQEKPEGARNYSWEFRQSAFKQIEKEIDNADSIIKGKITAKFKELTAKKYLDFAECIETGSNEVHDCAGLVDASEPSKRIQRLQSTFLDLKAKAEEKSWRCFSTFYAKFIQNPEKMDQMTVQKGIENCAKMISNEMKQVSL